MSIFRLQNNVPEVYINESRDFQLLCRLYDCIVNGIKFDIDSIDNLTNTKKCGSSLIKLLQTKLGFFTNAQITDDYMRIILMAFPEIIKNKGSKLAIKQAVRVYFRIIGMNTETTIQIFGKNAPENESPFSVKIGIKSSAIDTTILSEILKYVIPTGYTFYYVFYSNIDVEDSNITIDNSNTRVYWDVKYLGEEANGFGSLVRGSGDNINENYNKNVIGAVDTSFVVNEDSESGGI